MNMHSFQNRKFPNFAKFPFVSQDWLWWLSAVRPHAVSGCLDVTFRYKSKQWVYVEGVGGKQEVQGWLGRRGMEK